MNDLASIADDIRRCQACGLAAQRTNAVPGEGDPHTELLFIGEGPGQHEDEQGRPFVGAAGKLLGQLLAGIGLSREQVFITNVVKCRPPGNRDPELTEIETCTSRYLQKQLELIKPLLIVTLGRHAMERFLPGQRISAIHGQPKRVILPDLTVRVYYPVFHPAAALYRRELQTTLEQDFHKIPRILAFLKQPPGETEA